MMAIFLITVLNIVSINLNTYTNALHVKITEAYSLLQRLLKNIVLLEFIIKNKKMDLQMMATFLITFLNIQSINLNTLRVKITDAYILLQRLYKNVQIPLASM